MMPLTRRSFVTGTALSVPVIGGVAALGHGAGFDGGLSDEYPAQTRSDVQKIVGRAHTDVDTVRQMVTDRPELAKATWDWGFGDWESALGAASHMGRRDIAEILIAHGARPNLFTFAMFGQVDAVRAICTANPGIQSDLGPHGITLLQHARHGGDDARPVVEYLEELGDADPKTPGVAFDEAASVAYVGAYHPHNTTGTVFNIGFHPRRQVLTFARDDRMLRFLQYRGEHEFRPIGGASVRLQFKMNGDHATRLTVHDGSLVVTALRAGT